jgi:hypothetical protein
MSKLYRRAGPLWFHLHSRREAGPAGRLHQLGTPLLYLAP